MTLSPRTVASTRWFVRGILLLLTALGVVSIASLFISETALAQGTPDAGVSDGGAGEGAGLPPRRVGPRGPLGGGGRPGAPLDLRLRVVDGGGGSRGDGRWDR